MVRRYTHLGVEHLAEYANRLDKAATLKTGTNLAQAQFAENDGKIMIVNPLFYTENFGAPGGIRTPDAQVRS